MTNLEYAPTAPEAAVTNRHDVIIELAWRYIDFTTDQIDDDEVREFVSACARRGISVSPAEAQTIAENCKNTLIGESYE